MSDAGLRERKKARTRKRISDAATSLFIARGFDNVSVAEVAEAADVAKMTVFNYFPRKEDLMLDRQPETVSLLTGAVHGRAAGESPLAAVHRLVVELARERHPVSGVRDGVQPFFRTVLASPALQARLREQQEELETVLVDQFAEYPRPALVAAWTAAAYRTAYAASARRLLAGERADDIAGDHIALVNDAFRALERAVTALC